MTQSCVTKNYYSPQKKRILLLNTAEIRRKTQVRQPYCNLYAYGANNPVRYIDPTGRSAFSFFIQEIKNFRDYNNKYRTTQRTTIKLTYTIYSGNKNTLQDFKDRNNFKDGEIYEYGVNEMPKALADYSDLLRNKNIIIVTEEKDIIVKYDNVPNEYKTSEKERVIIIYEKKGDEYVQRNKIQTSDN